MMSNKNERTIGKTKYLGFQFGIRKTYPFSTDFMWDFLFSEEGLKLWLGDLESDFELKKVFTTKAGIHGYIRVFKPNSHIRLNWQKQDWSNLSLVQIRLIGNRDKTTLSFHQEKLSDAEQREEMKVHWNEVIKKITLALDHKSNN